VLALEIGRARSHVHLIIGHRPFGPAWDRRTWSAGSVRRQLGRAGHRRVPMPIRARLQAIARALRCAFLACGRGSAGAKRHPCQQFPRSTLPRPKQTVPPLPPRAAAMPPVPAPPVPMIPPVTTTPPEATVPPLSARAAATAASASASTERGGGDPACAYVARPRLHPRQRCLRLL